MGYQAPSKGFLIRIDAHPGFEAKAGSLSIEQYLQLELALDSDSAPTVPEQVANMEKILEIFAGALTEWNLEDQGEPVPATLEGVRSQESGFVLQIVRGWREAMAFVPPPLPEGSNSGESAPELSLPTATLSPSPSS